MLGNTQRSEPERTHLLMKTRTCFSLLLTAASLGCSPPPVAETPPVASEPVAASEDDASAPQDLASSICRKAPKSGALSLNNLKVEPIAGLTNQFQDFGNFEGPVWIDDALYFSNISGGTNPPPAVIWKWVPGQGASVVLENSGSNGLAVDEQGNLISAMHSDGTVSRRNPAAMTEATVLVAEFEGNRFNSPNDLSFIDEDRFYFTDPTWQAPTPVPQPAARAYLVMSGHAVLVGELNAPENPNGIAVSLDKTKLFIGGVNGLYRYELAENGLTKGSGTLIKTATLSDKTGIDGLGRDCAGNLYVTAHDEKAVVVLGPEGQELGKIVVPSAGGVTNVAFGGADRKTLFITSLGATPQIHQVTLNVTGLPY